VLGLIKISHCYSIPIFVTLSFSRTFAMKFFFFVVFQQTQRWAIYNSCQSYTQHHKLSYIQHSYNIQHITSVVLANTHFSFYCWNKSLKRTTTVLYVIVNYWIPDFDQGCQIFLGTTYQKRVK
jgi:hypothetical protein